MLKLFNLLYLSLRFILSNLYLIIIIVILFLNISSFSSSNLIASLDTIDIKYSTYIILIVGYYIKVILE